MQRREDGRTRRSALDVRVGSRLGLLVSVFHHCFLVNVLPETSGF